MAVTFYKVTTNNELVNAETLTHWGNTGLGSCEPLATSRHNLVLYVLLYKDLYI